ncbi:MAG: GNAT family N-acetyltransferase [Defluviitaleaceae bacterium]|nr:GNAT family N-acetyltransferase [Defluviitaleaceae bacterium]
MKIVEIFSSEEKADICNATLRALPGWFGIESGVVGYVEQVRTMPFYAAFDGDKPVGFVAVKVHNPFTAEVYVMGILEAYHRAGIGKSMIACCEGYCSSNKIEFLTVKTLANSRESKSYEKTRLFYEAAGFRPLEVFPLLWDESNPCLFMAKSVTTESS